MGFLEGGCKEWGLLGSSSSCSVMVSRRGGVLIRRRVPAHLDQALGKAPATRLLETEEGWSVSCLELPGCYSQGDSREGALANINAMTPSMHHDGHHR
jgi:hypothetical protein